MGRFDLLGPVVLFCLGIVWCREMFPRWREDWDIVSGKTGDYADKLITWLLWIVTTIVILGMALLFAIAISGILQWINS